MGKNNQQRRVAKRKARVQQRPTPPAGAHPRTTAEPPELPVFQVHREDQARNLVLAGARAVGHPDALDDAVQALLVFGGTAPGDALLASRQASVLMTEQLDALYRHGWQPADVLHVVRRERSVRIGRLAAAVIVEHGLAQGAVTRAPLPWLAQLESVGGRSLASASATSGWNALQHFASGLPKWEVWADLLTLVAHWGSVIPMEKLMPPPASWPPRRVARRIGAPAVGAHDPKKLATIRALLAKAEATEFAQEAETFTAKAQDLMTRYAIDEALLTDSAGGFEIDSRRLHIDNPYASTKAQLLATVGRVNRVKAIWNDQLGIVTVVGLPVDLDLAEMLFTSLLVQATRAMTEAGAASTGGHRLDRAPSFRRAFLLAYAQRIGERLTEAEERAQADESAARGTDLLPVLARQSAAVEQEFDRIFPHTRASRATRVDARGWQAGRAAADRAVLARGQVAR